jgi:Ca2+/H+ antiporter
MPKNLYTKPLIVAVVLFILGMSMLVGSLWKWKPEIPDTSASRRSDL